jgi:hypothetical protein
MKDEFLATLSHELRTPLNAILGWAGILQMNPTSAEISQALSVIQRNAKAQAQIIEDLLDMSRIISGKVLLDVRAIDLVDVLQASLETVRPAADAKGIRLQAILDPEAGVVSGDANRLQQVFWNLLTNAVKFTSKGGQVRVVLQRVASQVEVTVTDTGEGIALEFLPHVFDRFRQADATTTRRHGGLGLGLSIVKQIAELHGGSVRAHSTGIGQGSTFIVTLPLRGVMEPTPQPIVATAAGESAGELSQRISLAGINVLVVDDEPDARGYLRHLLEGCQATVTTAESAQEALAELSRREFNVLVSDIGMPHQDGYDLIHAVRALPAEQNGRIPAIALTAYAHAQDRMRAILAGFQLHVAKPAEPAELITMVASLCGRLDGAQ